jgi:hypothetical protein
MGIIKTYLNMMDSGFGLYLFGFVLGPMLESCERKAKKLWIL